MGSHEHETVDVRIIAATNHNLLQMMDQGRFRQDLFYRLSVVTLQLPNLQQRRGDIPELANHFLLEAARRNHTEAATLSADALSQLKQYAWPGNIRELKNVCAHISALFPGEVVHKQNLPLDIRECKTSSSSGYTLPEHGIDMESLEIDLIKQALSHSGGNKSKAAKLLGLSRDAFLYRLKKHNL